MFKRRRSPEIQTSPVSLPAERTAPIAKPDPLTRKISIGELTKAWGWKPGRLYRLCALRKIPHVRIAGQIFFEAPALDVWLSAQRRDAAPDSIDVAVRTMTREAECAALGIPVDHAFS